MKDQITFKVDVVLGRIKIDSFFRFEGDKMFGCCRATHYDKHGNVTKITESETGLVMYV
jgi:hypothetical protein